MAKGHISEDTIKFILEAESSQLQQEIHKSQKKVQDLETVNKELRKEQVAVKKALGETSKEYKDLTKRIKENDQAIANENLKIHEMTKQLGVGTMTMAQLRKEAKNLQKQLDNTSEALNPEAYAEYAKKLREVNERMSDLKNTAKNFLPSDDKKGGFLEKILGAKMNFGNLKAMLMSNGITAAISTVTSLAEDAVSKIQEMVGEGIEMAKSADGISHAFEKLNRPDILDKLREATHGTVNDVELMKAAVQAKDFRLPLDQLGKYLEFAQLKASQTGQSVDYMTNSIITGLGRKSLMILDNLGLSAAEVKEEMAKGGDMATAVGAIIDKQLAAQGEHYEDAAEREKRAIADVQNAQKELGDEMLPLAEKGSSMWQTIQVAALKFFTYLVRAFKQGVAKFVDLYNSSLVVRVGIASLTTSFKNMWAACKFAFNLIGTALKTLGKQLKSLGEMVEGVFTLDFAKVAKGFTGIFTEAWSGIKGQIKNFNDFGYEMGENLINGFHDAVDGKIKAPSFEREGSGDSAFPSRDLDPASGDETGKDGGKKTTKSTARTTDTTDRNLKDSRQKTLELEKQIYEESVRQYKKQLADKQISEQQFETLQLSLQSAYHAKLLESEKRHLQKIQETDYRDAQKKKQTIEEQQRNIAKAESDANNTRLAAYQDFQKKMDELHNSGMSETERMQRDHELQLLSLKGYYQAALQYAQDHNEELVNIELAYQKAKEKIETEFAKKTEQERQQIRQQYGLATADEEFRSEMARLNELLTQKKISQEDYEKAVAQLTEEYNRRGMDIRRQYGLVSRQEEYDMELEQLKTALDQQKITQEEYEQAVKQMRISSWKESIDYYQQLFSSAFSALQDAELANVEAKYDAEIEAARKAGKDTSALENKKAQDQLKVQKKYADVNFAVKASQIIADTAVSIMKSYADLGPIAGSVAAALMGITGAAQLAAANSEREKIKKMTLNGSSSNTGAGARVATGLEDGGFLDVERRQDGKKFHAEFKPDKRGFVDRPTVIVGEGPRSKEWVASNSAVENPTVAPLLYDLDRAQKAGTIRTFDLKKWVVTKFPGLESGGFLARQPENGVQDPPRDMHVTDKAYRDELSRLVIILDRLEQNGIPATVGLDQFDAQQKIRTQSRNIARKE